MRPVRRALKNIDVKGSSISEKDQIDRIKKHLLEIGDKISDSLTKYSDPDKIKEWRNYLWIFVSKFTTWSSERLKNVYKKLSKSRDTKLSMSQSSLTSVNDTKHENHFLKHIKSQANQINGNLHSSNKSSANIIKKDYRCDPWKREQFNENNEYAQAGWYSSSYSQEIKQNISRAQNQHLSFQRDEAVPKHSKNSFIKYDSISQKSHINKSFDKVTKISIDSEDFRYNSNDKKNYLYLTKESNFSDIYHSDKSIDDNYRGQRSKEKHKMAHERNYSFQDNMTNKSLNWPMKESTTEPDKIHYSKKNDDHSHNRNLHTGSHLQVKSQKSHSFTKTSANEANQQNDQELKFVNNIDINNSNSLATKFSYQSNINTPYSSLLNSKLSNISSASNELKR